MALYCGPGLYGLKQVYEKNHPTPSVQSICVMLVKVKQSLAILTTPPPPIKSIVLHFVLIVFGVFISKIVTSIMFMQVFGNYDKKNPIKSQAYKHSHLNNISFQFKDHLNNRNKYCILSMGCTDAYSRHVLILHRICQITTTLICSI